MFGIGWTEMLLIGVVALIVIGPKDLPVVMNRLGKILGSMRRMGSEFQRELNKATGMDQITDLRRSITEPLKQSASEIRSEFNKTSATGKVEPSGAIKPADPKSESVYKEIQDKIGGPAKQPYVPFTEEAKKKYLAEQAKEAADAAAGATTTTAAAAATAAPAESPAPPEATVPVKKPRAPRKPKAVAPAEPAPVIEPPPAPRKPRKPRTAKPRAEPKAQAEPAAKTRTETKARTKPEAEA